MVHLDDGDLEICARTRTGIAHCPQSNARLGSGIARIPEALARGVPVGLAVDGAASNEAADMLSEAHACWLLHRADPRAGERTDPLAHPSRVPQPGGHPSAMRVEDVVRIGSAGGAALLGLPGTGSLAVGQAADLAIYDLDQPRHFGLHDPAIGPVASGGRTRLRAVLVQGRIVVEHDTIPGLDLAQLRRDAQAFVQGILNRP
jgi:cytosine/adenosine deaminase-related metal-dependent hydrolase